MKLHNIIKIDTFQHNIQLKSKFQKDTFIYHLYKVICKTMLVIII